MIERFYSLKHLSTDQLREMFNSYRQQGWVDFQYHAYVPGDVTPPGLSDDEVRSNIHAGSQHNYFVFMLGHETEQDGIMIGYGLKNHPSFGAYLHLKENLLDEIVSRFSLEEIQTDVKYHFPEPTEKEKN